MCSQVSLLVTLTKQGTPSRNHPYSLGVGMGETQHGYDTLEEDMIGEVVAFPCIECLMVQSTEQC